MKLKTTEETVGFSMRHQDHVNRANDPADFTPFYESGVGNFLYVIDNATKHGNQELYDYPSGSVTRPMAGFDESDRVPTAMRVFAATSASMTMGGADLNYRFIRADVCSLIHSNGASSIVNGIVQGTTCASRKTVRSCFNGAGVACNAAELLSVGARA